MFIFTIPHTSTISQCWNTLCSQNVNITFFKSSNLLEITPLAAAQNFLLLFSQSVEKYFPLHLFTPKQQQTSIQSFSPFPIKISALLGTLNNSPMAKYTDFLHYKLNHFRSHNQNINLTLIAIYKRT